MIRVPILMYHSISDRPNAETRPLAVRPSAFAEQLSYLKENGFTPLTVADLVASLHRNNGRSIPERPVVVTFDDGYADFHSEALPVLERHDFPATVFLTSGWVSDAGKDAAGRGGRWPSCRPDPTWSSSTANTTTSGRRGRSDARSRAICRASRWPRPR